MYEYILTLSCADRMGIVHTVTSWLLNQHGNIIHAQQFGDTESKNFFLRVHFALPNQIGINELKNSFLPSAQKFDMRFEIHDPKLKAKLLILVSRQGHCLNDLLFRVKSGQLPAEITAVASNHLDFQELVESYGIEFHHLPVNNDNREQQERQILDLVKQKQVDLVVLARYMQILRPSMCDALAGKAINIHHSFLPGFKGARPYYQAHNRGVKIIGATAHYVTRDLDEGPIIEQDIERVNHAMSPQDLTRIGSDIESKVLSKAVRWHIEHKILLNGQRTVIFN